MYKLNFRTQNLNVKKTSKDLVYIANIVTRLNPVTNLYEINSSRIDVRPLAENQDVISAGPNSTLIAYSSSAGDGFNITFTKDVDSKTRKEIFETVSTILEEIVDHVIKGTALEFEA